jgi:hypothetical protein
LIKLKFYDISSSDIEEKPMDYRVIDKYVKKFFFAANHTDNYYPYFEADKYYTKPIVDEASYLAFMNQKTSQPRSKLVARSLNNTCLMLMGDCDFTISNQERLISYILHAQWHLTQQVQLSLSEFAIDMIVMDALVAKRKSYLLDWAWTLPNYYYEQIPSAYLALFEYIKCRMRRTTVKPDRLVQFDFQTEFQTMIKTQLANGNLGDYPELFKDYVPKVDIEIGTQDAVDKLEGYFIKQGFEPEFVEFFYSIVVR